ncbi:MAG: GIY-YIG nuclease family protein [Nitrososphaera sp.]|nr:GIY-YIG nuclease family protein [Nitrososphaera sp.]
MKRFRAGYSRDSLGHIPDNPGVYRIVDCDGSTRYVGRTNDLRRRTREHLHEGDALGACFISGYTMSNLDTYDVEKKMISRHCPPGNTRGKKGCDDDFLSWLLG